MVVQLTFSNKRSSGGKAFLKQHWTSQFASGETSQGVDFPSTHDAWIGSLVKDCRKSVRRMGGVERCFGFLDVFFLNHRSFGKKMNLPFFWGEEGELVKNHMMNSSHFTRELEFWVSSFC